MSLLDWPLVKDLGVPKVLCRASSWKVLDKRGLIFIFDYQSLSCAAPVYAENTCGGSKFVWLVGHWKGQWKWDEVHLTEAVDTGSVCLQDSPQGMANTMLNL